MSYTLYKVIHLTGVFMVLLSLGGLLVVHADGSRGRSGWRSLAAATNGIGLMLAFIAGFGLIARLELEWPWPAWVFLKVFIWLIFGAMMALAGRLPQYAKPVWWGSLLLAALAAYLANFKPF